MLTCYLIVYLCHMKEVWTAHQLITQCTFVLLGLCLLTFTPEFLNNIWFKFEKNNFMKLKFRGYLEVLCLDMNFTWKKVRSFVSEILFNQCFSYKFSKSNWSWNSGQMCKTNTDFQIIWTFKRLRNLIMTGVLIGWVV